MPGWLTGVLGWGVSGLKDLWNKAISVIMTVYNDVVQSLDALGAELTNVYHTLIAFIDSVEAYASALYTVVKAWAVQEFSNLISWATRQLAAVANDINSVISWVSNLISAAYAFATALVDAAKNWVIQNIYDPIVRNLTDALQWITTDGYYALQLLRNPPLLAKLLAKWVWQEWLSLARQYAGAFGAWLIHNMVSMASPIGSVIEDVIASIIE